MRRLTILIASGVLLLGACSTAASTPTTAPTTQDATATPIVSALSTPVPSSTSAAVVQAKVTFDGESCRYLGPMVVPSGTRMTIDFQPAAAIPAAAMGVAPVVDGTTLEDLRKSDPDWPPSRGIPPWVIMSAFNLASKTGPGSIAIDLASLTNSHAYSVVCQAGPPQDKTATGALIQVLPD